MSSSLSFEVAPKAGTARRSCCHFSDVVLDISCDARSSPAAHSIQCPLPCTPQVVAACEGDSGQPGTAPKQRQQTTSSALNVLSGHPQGLWASCGHPAEARVRHVLTSPPQAWPASSEGHRSPGGICFL